MNINAYIHKKIFQISTQNNYKNSAIMQSIRKHNIIEYRKQTEVKKIMQISNC